MFLTLARTRHSMIIIGKSDARKEGFIWHVLFEPPWQARWPSIHDRTPLTALWAPSSVAQAFARLSHRRVQIFQEGETRGVLATLIGDPAADE